MQSPSNADKDAIATEMTGGGDEVVAESYSEESTKSSLHTPASEGSMELRGTAPMWEQFKGKSRSADKVMDKSRRYRTIDGVPGVGTDDSEDISQAFAARIKGSVIFLRFVCQNLQNGKKVPYLGQAGILRNPANGVLKFATCKHNLGTEENEHGELEVCLAPHECVLADGFTADIRLPSTGWSKTLNSATELRDGITWSNGFDISLGPIVNEQTAEENWPNDPVRAGFLNRLLTTELSLDVVDDNFSYDEDLKIGIIVNNPGVDEKAFSEVGGLDGIEVENTCATIARGVKETKIAAVCEEKDVVMIYTGQITLNGSQHIEYNINTYKGCSGAIVIVMDRDHPDFGKALAVHAGYKTELRTNLGFKLAGAFDRPFSAEEW